MNTVIKMLLTSLYSLGNELLVSLLSLENNGGNDEIWELWEEEWELI